MSTVPHTEQAYRRGEEAPDGLLPVQVKMTHADDPKMTRREVYFVGLDDMDAPCVDAAVDRAERDNPNWFAQDWGAA